MNDSSHNYSSPNTNSLEELEDKQLAEVVVDIPQSKTPIHDYKPAVSDSQRKPSQVSCCTTRGSSPWVEERRPKLTAKSPLFGNNKQGSPQVTLPTAEAFPTTFPLWSELCMSATDHQMAFSSIAHFSSDVTRKFSEGSQVNLTSNLGSFNYFDSMPTSEDALSSPPPSDFEVKYKTEMCRNYQLTGHCKFGSKCSFAHGGNELRLKTHINPHYKSKRCSQFFEQGFCPYGYRCQYLHRDDSYVHVFHAYCEKIGVWMERNPSLDMEAIFRKTHPFVKRLSIFEKLESECKNAHKNTPIRA